MPIRNAFNLASHIEDFPKPIGLVNDFADVIPPDYEEKLVQITGELLRNTNIHLVVITLPHIGGEDYNEYAIGYMLHGGLERLLGIKESSFSLP